VAARQQFVGDAGAGAAGDSEKGDLAHGCSLGCHAGYRMFLGSIKKPPNMQLFIA
jgi:hypothetical protein